MSTTNEQRAERTAKAERREPQVDFYDPHFPAKRRETRQDRAGVFDPHFPQARRA